MGGARRGGARRGALGERAPGGGSARRGRGAPGGSPGGGRRGGRLANLLKSSPTFARENFSDLLNGATLGRGYFVVALISCFV